MTRIELSDSDLQIEIFLAREPQTIEEHLTMLGGSYQSDSSSYRYQRDWRGPG